MAENLIIEKLTEHDERFDGVDKRFDETDRQLASIRETLAEHDGRFDIIDKRFDVIVKKLLDHDDQFAEMRQEFKALRQEMSTGQDQIMKVLLRLDQERASTFSRTDRIEEKCDKNTTAILSFH